MSEQNTPEENKEDESVEDDHPAWGEVLDELDSELNTQVNALEFDDEWQKGKPRPKSDDE